MQVNLIELKYLPPISDDVSWEDLENSEWNYYYDKYVGGYESIYFELDLQEQFMFLCFVILSEELE